MSPVISERSHRPMTTIGPSVEVSEQEMADRVIETRKQHGDVLQQYHQVWYESGHTWVYTQFMGIGLMKSPNDLWAYQDLIVALKPRTIIETGTYQGGSALWFAFLLDMLHIDGAHVYTIDLEDRRQCSHPRITFLAGDSRDPEIVTAIQEDRMERGIHGGPLLVSLDADHSAEHVRSELNLYAPLCQLGDRLVVEDTNIAWMGPYGDRGARGGLEDYLLAHPGEWRQDVLCERYLLTMHPGGWLERVSACPAHL